MLAAAGVGRDDFVGIQLPNGTEYLEAMIAAFKLRAVPVNVNYRYVDAELRHLYPTPAWSRWCTTRLRRRRRRGGRRHGRAARGAGGRARRRLRTLWPHATRRRTTPRSADDLYCIYTGGTTGLPRSVLWRHEDIFFTAMGGGDPFQLGDHITRRAAGRAHPLTSRSSLCRRRRSCTPPRWLAFAVLFGGGRQDVARRSLRPRRGVAAGR